MVKGHSMPPRWLHSKEESQQVKVNNNYLLLKIPEELQQLNHAPEAITRPMPGFAVDVDLDSYEPDPILTTTAKTFVGYSQYTTALLTSQYLFGWALINSR